MKIDEDYKRYYPYDTLASKVIGFTGRDNQGIVGLKQSMMPACQEMDGKILTLTERGEVSLKVKKKEGLNPRQGVTYIQA